MFNLDLPFIVNVTLNLSITSYLRWIFFYEIETIKSKAGSGLFVLQFINKRVHFPMTLQPRYQGLSTRPWYGLVARVTPAGHSRRVILKTPEDI